jgi:hypothetical protein
MRYLAARLPLFFLCAHLTFIVPIYDGRDIDGEKEFTYSSVDFSKINSWPLYECGLRDLPCDSLVTVRYTVNTFGGDATWGATSLLTNIHFVILLALPVNSQE